MTRRSERYHIIVTSQGIAEPTVVQVNSRRVDALKRAKIITQTWPTAIKVEVRDTVAYRDCILFTWSRYTADQITAAIDAEAKVWAVGFNITDETKIEGRRQVMRANVVLNYLVPLLPFLAHATAKNPTRIYVGRRENCITEVGGLTHIYEGKYLICPDGPAAYDCEGAETITEARAIVENYRENYPTIEVCYV